MIEVKNVSKRYGKQLALDNVSFTIEAGQLTGFLGPNGAGKSTMMRIITGYMPASSGQVFIDGQLMKPNNKNLKRKIGYLPEHNPLYHELYVREYLEHIGRIYKVSNLQTRIKQLVEQLGLGNEQHKRIGQLSKGYRQRVGIAQALIHEPSVLIFDEASAGLDTNQVIEIRKLLVSLGREKTLMLSTHIMQEVQAVCNDLIIINSGKLVGRAAVGDVDKLSGGNSSVSIELAELADKHFFDSAQGVLNAQTTDGKLWHIECKLGNDIRKTLFEHVVAKGAVMLAMKQNSNSLEDVFQKLTK